MRFVIEVQSPDVYEWKLVTTGRWFKSSEYKKVLTREAGPYNPPHYVHMKENEHGLGDLYLTDNRDEAMVFYSLDHCLPWKSLLEAAGYTPVKVDLNPHGL